MSNVSLKNVTVLISKYKPPVQRPLGELPTKALVPARDVLQLSSPALPLIYAWKNLVPEIAHDPQTRAKNILALLPDQGSQQANNRVADTVRKLIRESEKLAIEGYHAEQKPLKDYEHQYGHNPNLAHGDILEAEPTPSPKNVSQPAVDGYFNTMKKIGLVLQAKSQNFEKRYQQLITSLKPETRLAFERAWNYSSPMSPLHPEERVQFLHQRLPADMRAHYGTKLEKPIKDYIDREISSDIHLRESLTRKLGRIPAPAEMKPDAFGADVLQVVSQRRTESKKTFLSHIDAKWHSVSLQALHRDFSGDLNHAQRVAFMMKRLPDQGSPAQNAALQKHVSDHLTAAKNLGKWQFSMLKKPRLPQYANEPYTNETFEALLGSFEPSSTKIAAFYKALNQQTFQAYYSALRMLETYLKPHLADKFWNTVGECERAEQHRHLQSK